MRFRSDTSLVAIALLLLWGGGWADDPKTVYSNIDTETGIFVNASDLFVWDDVQLVDGGLLTELTLVANNSRPEPQPGSVIEIQFRLFDNPNGGPIGTLLGEVMIDFTKSTYALENTLISADALESHGVVLPADAVVAVGVNFNDPTRSMGVVTFDPPTVGTSSDVAWVGIEPTPIRCERIVGVPVACSFGWQLRSTSAQTHPSSSELAFKVGIDHPTGRGAQSITVCDLNHDGKDDIVTANSIDHSVSVLLLNRNASLIRREDWPVTEYPTAVVCADMNRDGNIDILTSSRRHTVSVLLGDGTGSLSQNTDYSTGRFTYPISMAIADLDRDGKLDVVTANAVGSVSVLFGNGDGTLMPFRQYPVGEPNKATSRVYLNDLDLNGKPDVITANGFANSISILQTKWDGELRPKKDYATPRFPRALATGDVNHDGRKDIVVGTSDAVSVVLGRSDWFSFVRIADYSTENIRGIAVDDLDFDGNLDIAIASQMLNDALGVFLGNGDGTFQARIGFPGGYFPYDLVIADINRDSRPDVITVQENFVRILLNKTPRYDWERKRN